MKIYQGWSRGKPLLSHAIRLFDGCQWHGQWWPAYYNHTFLIFDWGDQGPRLIFESRDLAGIGFEPAEKLATSPDVEGYTTIKVCDGGVQAERIWERAKGMRGRGYDVAHLAVLFLAVRLEKRGFVTRYWHRKPNKRFTCNEAVQTALAAGDINPNEGVCDPFVSTPERQFLAWHKMPSKRWGALHGWC
jgi:hypothetical protein